MKKKKKQLSCLEAQKKIHNFINKEMESKETISFLNHISDCANCREELSIEYLVFVGLQRLDSASAFNLQKELDELMEESYRKAQLKQKINTVVMVIALLGAVIAGYFLSTFFYY